MLYNQAPLSFLDVSPEDYALAVQGMTEASAPGFQALLTDELKNLEVFNCARYRLTMTQTESWIAAGRPS